MNLSDTLTTLDEVKNLTDQILLEIPYDYIKHPFQTQLKELINKLKKDTIANLLELSETDDLSELSPDEQELYYEYESDGEAEDNIVGITPDGFHYLK